MRSAARGVEEKFMGESKEKGRMVLWTNSAMRYGVVEARVARPRSRRYVLEMPRMWQRRMLCGR